MKELRAKIWEALLSALPITAVVYLMALTPWFDFSAVELITFTAGAVLLVLGILLALVSHFFFVPEDPTKEKVRACLPGINCGACGYKGCDDYASALAKGEAAPNRCIPGGANTAGALSALLGIEIEKPKDVVAFVHCNGHCDAAEKKADYIGMANCRSAAMVYGGSKTCRFGCLGYGECANVGPTGAICMKDGIAHVDPSRCIGCGMCANPPC